MVDLFTTPTHKLAIVWKNLYRKKNIGVPYDNFKCEHTNIRNSYKGSMKLFHKVLKFVVY